MKSGLQVLEERAQRAGLTVPADSISGEFFARLRLPMIVHCTDCEETLAFPNAYVNDDGYTYCRACGLGED